MKIFNKSAPGRFATLEKFEAGIVLSGQEVKAIREGHADLSASYVKIINNEAWLVNAKIYPYKFARSEGYDETRTRKLLLHKQQIRALDSKLAQGGMTVVPLSLFLKNNMIKAEIVLAKGKKQYDHRAELKKKQQERDAQRELKRHS